MHGLLAQVRDSLGPTPRQLGCLTRMRLRARPPHWFPRNDKLMEAYRRQDLLLREGEAVWAALVQANVLLFEPGPYDHPAMAIFSTDDFFASRPSQLEYMASRLFSLKGASPTNPDEVPLAQLITDELERGMDWPLPATLTDGHNVRLTSFMVFRKHLPSGILTSGWFPVLVHPDTPTLMIVPSRFWPNEFLRFWSSRG